MSNEADNNNNNNNNNNSDNIQQQPIIKDNESDIQEELSEPLSPTEVIIDDEPAPAAGIPTYNLGDPPVPHDGRRGSDTYATRLAMEERREMLEEKLWDKYMRNMMMRNMMMIINMQRMMGAQTLMIGDPSGMHAGIGAIREELARLLKDYGHLYDYYLKEITSYMKAFRQRKESTLLKPTGENAQGR
jgi:hypothetical protein